MSVPTIAQYGTRLATALDDKSAKFRVGQLVTAAIADGYTLDDIASSIGRPAAERAFPGHPERWDALAATSRANGGFAMSKPSVGQYSLAWKILVKAGIEPTPAPYALAFRLVTRSGSSEARDALVNRVAAVTGTAPDAVEAERVALFVAGAADIVEGVNAGRREVKAPAAPAAGGDTIVTPNGNVKPAKTADEVAGIPASTISMAGKSAGKRTTTPDVTPVSLEVALETIRRIAVQSWSPADRAALAEALVEAATVVEADIEVVTPA